MASKANVRVEVRQFGDPMLNVRFALQRLRRDGQWIRRDERAKEYFVSKSRQRRAKERKAAFDRRVGK